MAKADAGLYPTPLKKLAFKLMATTPELETITIEVDSPPISPILFSYDSFDPPDVEEAASPIKRVRLAGNVRQSKRRKRGDMPRFEVQDEVAQHGFSSSGQVSRNDEVAMDDYARYVDAVVEKRAGFYPVSNELFVVQGWDDKSGCVKVS